MTRRPSSSRIWRASAVMLLALAAAGRPAAGQRPLLADELPPELEGVGIVERLNGSVPLDLEFTDETGRAIRLGDFFQPDRPVILTLNFYRCQMLCNLTLNGLVDALNGIEWSAGGEFSIVTVSIAAEETHELAAVKKKAYLTQYSRETAEDGWHFLTGDRASIDALAEAVGFGFRRVEGTDQYAHSSSIMFVTPDGRLSRYMNDVVFQPDDVRLALVEASRGAIGSPMEKFLLFTCYRYDPDANSYAVSALKVMRLAGVVTVTALAAGLVVLWLRGPRGHENRLVSSGLPS